MRLALIRESLRTAFRPRLLWLAEFLLNPAFALLAMAWLQLPETAGGLALTVVLGLAIGVGFLTLAGATLAWFTDEHAGAAPTLRGSFAKGLRHCWLLAIWAMAALAWCRVVDWAESYQYQLPNYVRSMMPAGMRGAVSEPMLLWLFLFVLGVASWVVMPAAWLPAAAQLAARGFRGFGREGFRAWGRALKSGQYWVTVALCALLGVWLPKLLLGLRPEEPVAGAAPAVAAQMASLVVRLLAAYVLALCAWMWVASATGRAGAKAAS